MELFNAIEFAEKAHKNQIRRESGLPYITHCFNVYSILRKYKSEDSGSLKELCTICMLHDCLEDTDATHKEITEKFGESVANTVKELTNNTEAIKKYGKIEYINQKMLKMSDHALLIKLADFLANLTDNPNESIISRVEKHVNFISRNRTLTTAQNSIVAHIRQIINKLEMQNALLNVQ